MIIKSHAPKNYPCPICLGIKGIESDETWIVQNDIFYRDAFVMGFIVSKSITSNEHHPLIVPTQHFENLYDLPSEYGHCIFDFSVRLARALKEVRKCDGITLVQNNEPAGDQHAFHYHLHLVPRFTNDQFHAERWKAQRSSPEDRAPYALALRKYFEKN